MMNLWSFIGTCDGELFTSTHLTEKGALLNAIEDVLMFLGVDDDPADAFERYFVGEDGVPCYDLDEMRKMNREELTKLFGEWAELTWDNQQGYQVEIIKTQVQA
tara:strand:- start:32 stop:343 length:312 start_codon:yes stop_codon:yes gene_type:complete